MIKTAIFRYFHKIIQPDYLNSSMVNTVKMQSKKHLGHRYRLLFIMIASFFIYSQNGFSQIYQEDFDFDFSGICASQGTNANTYLGWTVTDVTANGGLSNRWYVSSAEGGGHSLLNPCGERCAINPMVNNQTLHIGTFAPPPADVGATYTGFNVPSNLYTTDRRAETPTINCSGSYNITLEFDYSASANTFDKASVELFDGTTWTSLGDLVGTGVCGPTSINWGSFSIQLPPSANDNPDVKIGFRWMNNSDGSVEASSVAIDFIVLTAGAPPAIPVANFQVLGGNDTFCETGCTTFEDLSTFDPDFSTGAANATYAWTFPGGIPATSTDQNPTVCYDTPGDYNVTLTVTDNIGASDPFTITNVVHVEDCGPDIAISVSNTTPCANEQCVDFTDLSTTAHPDGIISWLWTFTSPTGVVITSTDQNPTNICMNETGFWDVNLAATDADLTEVQNFPDYIEVLNCSGPDINFTATPQVICPGGCIQLTDLSTSFGTITSWHWDLPGGQAVGEENPEVSTQQNPIVCYENPGTYSITLSATDQEGPSVITQTITITVDPCTGPPQANFSVSDTAICSGDCVDFTNLSLGLVEDYLWVFQGTADIDDATSSEQNPSVICYSEPGVYNVTLTVSNSNGEIDSKTMVDYITVEQCLSKPVPRVEVSADTICAGTCVDYTSVSTGIGVSAWEWNFQGAVDGATSSTLENPSGICYNNPGSYSVSLKVTGAGGDSLRIFENIITVVSTPECRPQIEVTAPDTVCAGDCVYFPAVFTAADSVRWTFQGGNPSISTAQNPGLICFEEVGQYMVIVEAWNAAGAAQPTIFDLFVGERPPLNAGPNQTIHSGAQVELTGTIVGSNDSLGTFLWQPFDLVDNFQAQTVHTSPDETTQYIVYYHEIGTCTAIDTVTVFVNFVATVGVPTAFSPNGDGENDVLSVLGQGIAAMTFKIYNRYGQLVFESDVQEEGWNGTQNGKELNPGTFVYTLEVLFAEGGLEVYTGNVTLVR